MTAEERESVLGMLSSSVIAQLFGCHHLTITRLHKRYQQTEPPMNRPRPRPVQRRVMTPRQGRHIVPVHRTLPAARTAPTVQGQ